MSRKMNRRQMSPVKIKSITEQRRSNLNADVHRIINHAAKLISEYNRNTIDKLLEEDLDNQTKIDKLMKESVSNLPKISLENNAKISRKRKRKKHSTEKDKKNNTECESDKIEYNFIFEDHDSDQQTSKSGKNRNSLQSKNSVLSIKLDQKMEDISNHNDDIISKNVSPTISSDLSIEKSTSCSICSEKHVSKKNDNTQPPNMTDLRYIYEVEIKTGNEKIFVENANIAIQLYGESKNMDQSIKLNEINSNGDHTKLFTPGNVDKFSIVLDECLGSILRVKIGIESENEDTLWDLDYLCVRDCIHKSDYFFSCRRRLGINSSDKLAEVTLVYTPPFKMNKHNSLSKSNTENLDEEQFVEAYKLKKLNSKSINSSRSHSSLSQQLHHSVQNSEQVQQLEADHSFSKNDKNKSDDKDLFKRSRNRKISSTIPNDDKIIMRSQRSMSSPESDKNQLNKEVYSMETFYHDTDIHSAVRSHNILRVKQLCENDGNKKNELDEIGCSPIHLAGIYFQDVEECKEILQYFISLGIDINTKSTNYLTCLHYAVIENNFLAVKYLIEYCGADPNVTDENGDSSLQIANKYNFPKIAKYLANINLNSESIKDIPLNDGKYKDPYSNLTIRRNSSDDLTNLNQTATDIDKKNHDKKPNVSIEKKKKNHPIDKNNSVKHNESSDSEQSDNSYISPVINSFSTLRIISPERKVSTTSSDSSSSSEQNVIISTPNLIVEPNSRSLSPTNSNEITTPIAKTHQANSTKSFESKDGKLLLDQPIIINNLDLTPIPISTDNSVEISENDLSVQSERISDKDNLDNQESRQLEAENYGFMLHKSLPDRKNRKLSLNSNESKASKDNSNISSNSSRSITSDKQSDIKLASQNTVETLNKNNPVDENLEMKRDYNSVESPENLSDIESERKEINKAITDKDNPDNLESRQLEAESHGIMLHKSLPNRKEILDEELSNISSDVNESEISSRNSVISPITPRSNSVDKLSEIEETNLNKSLENSNKNVSENVQMKTENFGDNNENLVETTSSEENNNKNNISKADLVSNDSQKDHSIPKDQFQSTLNQSS